MQNTLKNRNFALKISFYDILLPVLLLTLASCSSTRKLHRTIDTAATTTTQAAVNARSDTKTTATDSITATAETERNTYEIITLVEYDTAAPADSALIAAPAHQRVKSKTTTQRWVGERAKSAVAARATSACSVSATVVDSTRTVATSATAEISDSTTTSSTSGWRWWLIAAAALAAIVTAVWLSRSSRH